MPTVPLFMKASHPDAWHQVRAPGGYEWWYFDAEDREHERQLVAILFEGFVFHPGYLRRYSQYRNAPTRHAPPVPSQYPAAYFVLYEQGRLRWQFMAQYAPDDFRAATDRAEVAVGPNMLRPRDDGSLELIFRGTPWELTWKGPKLLESSDVAASMRFIPRGSDAPLERIFLSRALARADHHWVIANPRCDVEATITHAGQTIAFRGRGYHDHNYGTGPLGPGLARWFWGRVLTDDGALTFHHAHPHDPSLTDEVYLIEADAAGMREIEVSRVTADWSGRTRVHLAYPRTIAFDDVLRLSNPRTIDVAPFYMRLIYDAEMRTSSAGRGGRREQALCEVAYPHRLRWPILGRMIEMSIDRRRAALKPRPGA
jgi:carotenoid 1,2-hydratase